MKKKLSLILTLIILFIYITPVQATIDYPYYDGVSAYLLMDLNTGEILVDYNIDETLYPASITKIMTAILAIEMGESDEMMTASTQAVYDIGRDGMNIGIQPGEVLALKDLLGGLLIASANETANIIAENISASRSDFIAMMNYKAKQIGATNTNYTNPCGMHDSAHYTTARDVALISRYAMQYDRFRDLVKRDFYVMSTTNKHSNWNTLYSSNTLMRSEPEVPYDIIGVKTGYTDPAGKCLVSAAKDGNGNEYLTVVLGAKQYNAQDKIEEITLGLFNYAFDNFHYTKLLDKDSFIDLLTLTKAKNNTPIVLLSGGDVWALLDKNINVNNVNIEFEGLNEITLPVQEGDAITEGKLVYENEVIATFPIYAANTVEEAIIVREVIKDTGRDNTENIKRIGQIMLYVCMGLFVLFEILNVIARARRRKKRRRIISKKAGIE